MSDYSKEEQAIRAAAKRAKERDGVGTSPSAADPGVVYYGKRGEPPTTVGDHYYRERACDAPVVLTVTTLGAALVVRFIGGGVQAVSTMPGQFAGPLPRPVERAK